MRVLYITHEVALPIHQHIVDFLRSRDIEVDLELISANKDKPWEDAWVRFRTSDFIEEIKSVKYDFIVSNTHSSYIRDFFNNVAPNFGVIDVEHDLFSCAPEYASESKSTILTFHKRHYKACVDNGLRAVNCRWPLFDIEEGVVSDDVNAWSDVLLIGSYVFTDRIKQGNFFEELLIFDKIWYKKYREDDSVFKETEALPDFFCGPRGTKFCFDLFNFIVTQQSSCFVEALLFKKLPILLSTFVRDEEKINDILSLATLETSETTIERIPIVTTNNLEYKINKLNNDINLYNEIVDTMREVWVGGDYMYLPSPQDAIYDLILRRQEV